MRRVVDEGEALSADLGVSPAICARCGAAHLVAGVAGTCPTCGRGELVSGPAEVSGVPERVVPFVVDEAGALKAIAAHVAEGGWFLVGDLSPSGLRKTLRRVWWPEWLVDADLDGSFSLEVGFDYQVKSNKERFDGSNWNTFEEIDTRIRWEPRVGRIRRRLHDVAAVALVREAAWSARVGPTDRGKARPFDRSDLDDAVVRVPDLPPDAAWGEAQPRLTEAAAAVAQTAAEAAHKRDLSLTGQWSDLHWTWQLLPAWTASYDDGSGQRWLFVVNGQTGKVTGARLKSATLLWLVWGSLAAMGFGLAFFGALCFVISIPLFAVAVGVFLFVIGIVAFVFGLLLGIFSAIPLFSGLSWNREQRALQPG